MTYIVETEEDEDDASFVLEMMSASDLEETRPRVTSCDSVRGVTCATRQASVIVPGYPDTPNDTPDVHSEPDV